jgi:cyclopropane fatty-acyl-phospholipid synthase-like methyltransferase
MEWFQDWFDTKYYHILYQDRNDEEAQFFMRNLTSYLYLKKGSKLLDLPCGKGRHSIYLNSLGFNVTGADLSKNSIQHAKNFENNSLNFVVHDMREPFKTKFDAILNLFTSFGYFDQDEMNIEVLKNLKNGLNKEGVLVIDFMNVNLVEKELIKKENILKNEIEFHINRSIENGFIKKDIRFTADNIEHHHTEYVRFLSLDTFKRYIKDANLKLKHTFGDYNLNSFDIENSNRLILVLE